MKTIKKEEYKGYRIIVQGRYEEDTKVYQLTDVHYDSVILKLLVTSNHRNYLLNESLAIEKDRENNEQLYGETNKAIEDLIEKAKKAIDKKIREEEISNGLPESLLSIEEENSEEEVDLFDAIYEVAKVAIKDHEKETAEKVAEKLIKAYKILK